MSKKTSSWGRRKSGRSQNNTKISAQGFVTPVFSTSNPTFRAALCKKMLVQALNPFPPVWRTTMQMSVAGSIVTTSAATNTFLVDSTSVFAPLNTSTPMPNLAGGVGSVATAEPAGFSGLMSATGPYLNFRVLGVAARWRVIPGTVGDTMEIVIAPGDNYGGTHSSFHAASQAYGSKKQLVVYGKDEIAVEAAFAISQLGGVDAREIVLAQDWQGTYNAKPSNRIYLEFLYQTCDSATLGAGAAYTLDLSYDVILETPTWVTAPTDDVDILKVDQTDDCKSSATTSSSSSSSSSSSCKVENRASSSACGQRRR